MKIQFVECQRCSHSSFPTFDTRIHSTRAVNNLCTIGHGWNRVNKFEDTRWEKCWAEHRESCQSAMKNSEFQFVNLNVTSSPRLFLYTFLTMSSFCMISESSQLESVENEDKIRNEFLSSSRRHLIQFDIYLMKKKIPIYVSNYLCRQSAVFSCSSSIWFCISLSTRFSHKMSRSTKRKQTRESTQSFFWQFRHENFTLPSAQRRKKNEWITDFSFFFFSSHFYFSQTKTLSSNLPFNTLPPSVGQSSVQKFSLFPLKY